MKWRRVLTLWLVLAVVAAGQAVFAADDGGGRSVFAYGAGSRALGLGGAYGAVADDASAVLWNPGGLGLVHRAGMEVTQTSYYGLDVSEQYASLVFPHWRYGTASVTFRRFGVGGIEQRDDRNALLSSDLSSSETELLLGYGRRLGRVWSVGGAVKLRRQNVADFGDSGIGLDLGVIFHPLAMVNASGANGDRLSIGLAVRNAVRPEVRLMEDRVVDPAGVRLGAAYSVPVFGRQMVMAAVDVEKTVDTGTRLHAGVEYAPHPMLRLRMGASDGSFTAGSGAVWNGVTVDYTFEQNAIEDVHRVGATFAFGHTVAENRQAAMDARENELRARLDASYAQRQAQRVRSLLTRADAARGEARYQDALVLLNAADALDPENAATTQRRVDCYVELGRSAETRRDNAAAMLSYSAALEIDPAHAGARSGYERSRAESDRMAMRTEERRRQFADAMDAFVERRLEDARDGFAAILETSPGDEEAAAMLDRAELALSGEVDALVEQAARYIEWNQFDEAASVIAQAGALSPQSPDVAAARAHLERARSSARAQSRTAGTTAPPKATGDKAAAAITPEQRREADRLYQSALQAVAARRSDDAIRYLELVWTIDPGYQRVAEHLKREYLTRGMEFFADGDLDRAIELWERALRVDPDDARARGYLSRAREQATKTREILGGSR